MVAMSQKIRTALLFIIPIAVILLLFLFRHMASKTIMNDDYVNGNTGSNLYNDGLFCENGDTLFFSNPDDGRRLYSMKRDGSELKRISEDVASSINADDHYVYYTRNNRNDNSQFAFLHVDTNSLCRLTRKDGKILILDPDPDLYASLVGNYVYYMHYGKSDATTLYRVRIDGKEKEQVMPAPVYPCSARQQYIYYTAVDTDLSVSRMDTVSGQKSVVIPTDSWNPVLDGNYVYYMVPSKNYAIYRTNLADMSTEVLTSDRADCFLVSQDTLFYQRNSATSPALIRQSISTGQQEVVAEGNYHCLNAAFGTLYFLSFEDDNTFYQVPLSGGTVSTFHPGKEP